MITDHKTVISLTSVILYTAKIVLQIMTSYHC